MTGHWEANLRLLDRRGDPESRLLRDALAGGPGPDLGLRDRTGNVLPGFVHQGRPRSLVSTFDAGKEAERWAEGVEGGTVAVYGAGGRNAFTALAAQGVRGAFWVEPRIEVWRSLVTWQDGAEWLDREEWVPVLSPPEAWEATLKDRYHPLWDGAFRTLEWRGATLGQEGLWDGYRAATTRALDALASDASTQARFGERWYRNTLVNLRRLSPGKAPSCPGARVVVAGAGPTLDDALDHPDNLKWLAERPLTGDKLFSTDTALPALTSRGVVPDLVLCLDGQLPTYHHFVPRRPGGVPLVADLSSLPLLDRLGMPVVRYLSGHPFGAVVRRYFPELPTLDGSLGNVSGLALKTALALGARVVDAWGVDFGYRDGQAYAHGTYVYPLAARRATRLEPMETRLGASCYGARGLERTPDARGHAWDTTPLLRDYRSRWEAPTPRPGPVKLAHEGAGSRWNEFATHWRLRLNSLPLPGRGISVHRFILNLPPDRRQDWFALWPLALSLQRTGIEQELLPEATRDRALEFLQD